MTAFRLGLPADIPWTRLCVTEDMIDPVVCDNLIPAKWQSSVAVFRFIPQADDQLYEHYEISYLKVTASITGYQPPEDEIQGVIDWDGIHTATVEAFQELLQTYSPCTGAILQVVVGPHEEEGLPKSDYPFFLDFEPKKRELYEMSTDTKERQSRSNETLYMTKSAATSQGQEVLDVDMGSSSSGGGGISVGGFGVGLNLGSSNQGQWGTKSMNTQQSQVDRSRDVGQELRESFSYTTQLSQMYNLLNSYHLGTNRAVFFIQPRPHVLEEPTGFVRGPRKIEGIQEFVLVVAKPREAADYCVAVRLDTGHLAEEPEMDFDEKHELTEVVHAYARIPNESDPPANLPPIQGEIMAPTNPPQPITVPFKRYVLTDHQEVAYAAPDNWEIGTYTIVINEDNGHGRTAVVPDDVTKKSLTMSADADSHIAINHHGLAGIPGNLGEEIAIWDGRASIQLNIHLRSQQKTKKIGSTAKLLIATRGLCCCGHAGNTLDGILDVIPIPHTFGGWQVDSLVPPATSQASAADERFRQEQLVGRISQSERDQHSEGSAFRRGGPPPMITPPLAERQLPIREANALSDFVRESMQRARGVPSARRDPTPFIYSDLFISQLAKAIRRTRQGLELTKAVLGDVAPRELVETVANTTGLDVESVTVEDLINARSDDLTGRDGLSQTDIARLRLSLLGVPTRHAGDEHASFWSRLFRRGAKQSE